MKLKTLIAACSMSLSAQSEHFVIIPEGEFRGIDGRPFDAPAWILTPERGHQIVAALNQRHVDMVIDYEHSTLIAKEKGEPAPAAGWLRPNGFTYVEGVGVCSTQFEWTDKAKGFIESDEYKYISPVFFYNETGAVLGLHSVALTNTPNLDQLPEAKLAAAAQDFLSTSQDSEMNEELLERLRWMLNLPVSATAEDIIAELNKLASQLNERTGTTIAANAQNLFDAVAAIDQLKVAANSRAVLNPAEFVPMAVYKEALSNASTANANAQAKELDDLIVAACSDGRLTGQASINWIKDQAKTSPEFVKTHLESLPKIAALTQQQTQTTRTAANHQQGQFTEEDLAVAAAMGVDLGAGSV
ncbi:MAG: phage protease [Acinetobacter sp.]